MFETQKDGSAYSTQLVMTAGAGFEPSKYRDAWQAVVDAHAIFRSSFHQDGLAHPVQVVMKEARFDIEIHDESERAKIDEIVKADACKGFDLTQAPLTRATCIKVRDGEYRVIWTFHHLLLDGWSFGVVFKEMFDAYAGQTISAPGSTFERFVEHIYAQDMKKAREFWKSQVSKVDAPTDMRLPPPVPETPSAFTTLTDVVDLPFSAVEQYCAERDITISTLLRAAWALHGVWH